MYKYVQMHKTYIKHPFTQQFLCKHILKTEIPTNHSYRLTMYVNFYTFDVKQYHWLLLKFRDAQIVFMYLMVEANSLHNCMQQ